MERILKCSHCGETIPGEDLFKHAEICKAPMSIEQKNIHELHTAANALNLDISWMETQCGSHITVRAPDLLRLLRAIKAVK